MRLLFWIASRNLASRRLHAVCAILGIAFGVATVVAIQILDHNTVISLREHHRRFTGDPDRVLTIRNPRDTGLAAARGLLERDPGIRQLTPLLSGRTAFLVDGKPKLAVPFFALDANAGRDFDAYAVHRGRSFQPGERGVFLCGYKAAEAADLKIGQAYRFRRPSVTAYGCADGEVVEISGQGRKAGPEVELQLIGVLADSHLGRANSNRTLVMPTDDGVALMGGMPHLTRFWVHLKPDANVVALTERLDKPFRVEIPESREVGESREEKAFRSGVRLASFMALGLGLFIIFHLLTLAVTSWVRQVGLLGALGITGAALAGTFLLEALLLAVLGTGAGLGIGVGIAKAMVAADLSTLGWGRPVYTFEIPWGSLGWVSAAGIGACLLGAIQPIARIRRIPVLDALVQGESAIGSTTPPRWLPPFILAITPGATLGLAWLLHPMQKDFLEVAGLIAGVFAAFVMALWSLPRVLGQGFGMLLKPLDRPDHIETFLVRRGLSRGIRRFAGSVTGLSLVAAGIVALHAITGSLKHEKDTWAESALPGRVFLEMDRVPREQVGFLSDLPGVTSVVPLDASFRQGLMEVRGVPAAAMFSQGLLQDDSHARQLFEQGRGIVITTQLARDQGFAIGDKATFSTLQGPRRFQVLAVEDRFGFHPHERSYALLEEETVRKVFCRSNDIVNICAVGVQGPDQERDVRQAILEKGKSIPGLRAVTGSTQRDLYREEINRDFALFDVILLLTALLAGMGLLNSLLVAGMERTKETGLLRAVGITRRQVFRLFLAEAAMLGLASGILGSAMGVLFARIAVSGLQHLSGLPLVFTFTPVWILVSIGVLTAFSVLAAVIPALRAGRADVIRAIKYE